MLSNTKRYQKTKLLIYQLDAGRCHICRRKVKYTEAALDHIIPKASSGRGSSQSSDEYWNLRLAHKGCNSKRGAAKIAGQLRLFFEEVS